MVDSTTASAAVAVAPLHQNQKQKQQQQQQQTFPFKLYEMIEYAHDSEFSTSISWLPDGSAFFIHGKDVMMNDLAPMFFNQTKFRSFVSVFLQAAAGHYVIVYLSLILMLHKHANNACHVHSPLTPLAKSTSPPTSRHDSSTFGASNAPIQRVADGNTRASYVDDPIYSNTLCAPKSRAP